MSTSELVERLLTAPGPLSTEDRRAAAARLDELERENARMREALQRVRSELEMHINWKPTGVAVEVAIAFEIAREALAGNGEP
jgi:hypothetical protein